MFVHRRDVQIQWGDCDPANIVYYPRYFAMFDDATSIMFEAAGCSKQDIVKTYGLVGIPMVDTRAKFYISSTHGDWITIESRVETWKRSSFDVLHKVFKGDALAIEAWETRVLVGKHPDDANRLKSAPSAARHRRAISKKLTCRMSQPKERLIYHPIQDKKPTTKANSNCAAHQSRRKLNRHCLKTRGRTE